MGIVKYIKQRIKWKIKSRKYKKNSEIANRIHRRYNEWWPTSEEETLKYEELKVVNIGELQKEKYWQRLLFNKINVWKFVNSLGVKTPDIYWKGRDIASVDFSKLPKAFVVKPNYGHSSQMIYPLVESVNIFDGKRVTKKDIIKEVTPHLEGNPNLEFFIEEFNITEEGEYTIPDDYKFYAFNGEIACVQLVDRTGPNKAFTRFYTEDWKPLPNVNAYFDVGKLTQPPQCYNEMLEAAKALSKNYKIFCRIDFYATKKGAVLGELSPTPLMGYGFTNYGDDLLISYWDKYCRNMI